MPSFAEAPEGSARFWSPKYPGERDLGRMDSNHRVRAPKARALPLGYAPKNSVRYMGACRYDKKWKRPAVGKTV